MKKLIISTGLALAGLLLSHTPAQAQAGDLILGFQDSLVSNDLETNLGTVASFLALEGTGDVIYLNVGSTNTVPGSWGALSQSDLTTLFAGNLSNSSLFWGVAGTGSANNELVITDPSGVPGVNHSQGSPHGAINTLASDFTNYSTTGGGSTDIEPANGGAGAWGAEATSNGKFGGLVDVQTLFPSTGSVDLNLYDVVQGSTGVLVGTFVMDSSGDLQFDATQAVPEPKTYVLLSVALVVMAVIIRRRMIVS